MSETNITSVEAIGHGVQMARKEQHLTQKELSRLSGTGIRFISDLENGKENIHLGKTISVLLALGLSLTLINKWSK